MEKIKINKNLLKVSYLAFVFFAFDVFTKALVLRQGNVYYEKIIINNFFKIRLTENTGAAFSILENNNILLVAIGFIALYIIYKYLNTQELTKFSIVSYSLLIGGICGNLYNRIKYSAVIDFLSFKFFSYDFPIFNFADTFIVISVCLIIIDVLRGEKNEVRSNRRKHKN